MISRYIDQQLAHHRQRQLIRARVLPDPARPGGFLGVGPEAMAIRPGDYVISLGDTGALVRQTVDVAEGPLAVREVDAALVGGTRSQRAVELNLTPVGDIEDEPWAKYQA
jgi:hypothetical protein